MKPWLVDMFVMTAGAALALATISGAFALTDLSPTPPTCGASALALTLAFDPAVAPDAVLAGLEATSASCPESLRTAR